jgi:hypothetical protein
MQNRPEPLLDAKDITRSSYDLRERFQDSQGFGWSRWIAVDVDATRQFFPRSCAVSPGAHGKCASVGAEEGHHGA